MQTLKGSATEKSFEEKGAFAARDDLLFHADLSSNVFEIGHCLDCESPDFPVTCFFGAIPASVKVQLEKSPVHVFLRLEDLYDRINTYIEWRDGRPAAVFLFELRKDRIVVVNPLPTTTTEEIARFAKYIFTRFRFVHVIGFNCVQSELQRSGLSFPFQRYRVGQAHLVELPGSAQEYEKKLGKSTRKTIKYSMARLFREFPGASCRAYAAEEIKAETIRAILKLKEARFEEKGVLLESEQEAGIKRMIRLAKSCGFVTVIEVDGKVCAGSINFQLGENFVGHVLSHDPAWGDFRVGTICAYFTICEAIARGGRKFDLGLGRFNYKRSLTGVSLDMDRVEIFRSKWRFLFKLDSVAKNYSAACFSRSKQWFLRREKSAATQFALKVLYLSRKIRLSLVQAR